MASNVAASSASLDLRKINDTEQRMRALEAWCTDRVEAITALVREHIRDQGRPSSQLVDPTGHQEQREAMLSTLHGRLGSLEERLGNNLQENHQPSSSLKDADDVWKRPGDAILPEAAQPGLGKARPMWSADFAYSPEAAQPGFGKARP